MTKGNVSRLTKKNPWENRPLLSPRPPPTGVLLFSARRACTTRAFIGDRQWDTGEIPLCRPVNCISRSTVPYLTPRPNILFPRFLSLFLSLSPISLFLRPSSRSALLPLSFPTPGGSPVLHVIPRSQGTARSARTRFILRFIRALFPRAEKSFFPDRPLP